MKRKYSDVDTRGSDACSEDDDGWVESSEIKCNHIYLEGDITQESSTDLINEIDRVSFDIIKIKFKYDIKDLPIYSLKYKFLPSI